MPNPYGFNAASISRRSLLAAPVALGAVAASRKLAFAAGPQKGGTLRVATYSNPTSLDPMTSRSGSDFPVLNVLFEALFDFDPETLAPKPGLAQSWEYKDPKTLVMVLRQGVTFHDGTPFNADAVKANLDRNITDKTSAIASLLDTVATIEATDANTVTLRLKQPDTTLPAVLSDQAGLMSSPKAFAAGADYARHPVGTGPFVFVSWADGDSIVVKRNDKYWQPGLPYLDEIDYKIITDTNTGARSVLAGQNDISLQVSEQSINSLKAGNMTVGVFHTLRVLQCYINFSRPPMSDVRVRQAMNLAIDRAAFTKVALSGYGETGDLYVPKSHWAYDEQAAKTLAYDPDKAKKLLADAGFGSGMKLNVNYYSDQLSVQRMEILRSFWSKVGINIDKQTVGTISDTNALWRNGTGDIRQAPWGGRPDPAITYNLMFAPKGFFNIGNVEASPDFTKALADATAMEKQDERKEAMTRVVRLERQLALGLPLAFEPDIVAYRPAVKGYIPNLAARSRLGPVYLES